MPIRIVQVDAFTARPFTGNPAAVCVLQAPPTDQWMRDVAREMNLSETAFLTPHDDGYTLRWFTPAVEVDLCGHATVAAAHVLWEDDHLPAAHQARFHTRSGLLLADRRGDWIELDFPAKVATPAEPPPTLLPALGVQAQFVARNQFDYLVEVESEETLRAMTPDFTALRKVPVRGVIVTARPVLRRSSISSRASSPRRREWTKTQSRARRTARWARTGPSAWARASSRRIRRRRAAAWCGCGSVETA